MKCHNCDAVVPNGALHIPGGYGWCNVYTQARRNTIHVQPRIPIPIKLLTPDAKLPAYAHGPGEDAGMDLFSAQDYELYAGEYHAIRTGIAIELPPGYEGQIRSRSGLAAKYAVTVLNSPGTVDSGFRGEVMVLLKNGHRSDNFTVRKGDRIAQLVIAQYSAVEWRVTEALAESERGEGGLGSTGR